ncbi:MAG TPA: carbamoyltransferase HypF [Actinomycetes bacterium]|nr:carbamoyltransferase HypF [Actinomycetes bacterium]
MGLTRTRVRVEGIVQGVGFRPFVHALAGRLGLAGLVGNDAAGVFVEVEGAGEAVERFLDALAREAPPLAVIERVTATPLDPTGARGFAIAPSRAGGERQTLVSPDTATCADCLRELADPADRRHRYPFINCTNCGPRFTIVRDVPYDRPATTMAGFAMCADCAREYHDPADRRFHAQPVCCPACGPALRLLAPSGLAADGEPLAAAGARLRDGAVVAVKGLGGYHLAADAACEPAVAALRARKHREDKPFAVMAADLEAARALCLLDPAEAAMLASPRRPIVLLRRRPERSGEPHGGARVDRGAPVASSVAPANRSLGVLLPYTPLHHLLLAEVGRPIVLTSGNVSDEPIAYLDDEAMERLAGIADWFLVHDRPIHVRADDSVVRGFRGRELPLRRSRGFAPQPLPLPWPFPRHVLACGAELKSTFCLAKGNHAFVSHHVGDLENYETFRSFTEGVEHFRRLFAVQPEVVAHDLHPEYLSTKYAAELDGVELEGVQHHHAHVAACLADNGQPGPVIGVAFDGLGYGTDGTIWGGELLVADLEGFRRAGHLEVVAMPGGTAAIKEPWRMAAAWLDAAFGGQVPERLAVVGRNLDRWERVVALARSGTASPATSSAGRLFDAVAAILGVRDAVNYEGQAAVELEQLADPGETAAYPARVAGTGADGGPLRLVGSDLVRAVVEQLEAGVAAPLIAARFHNGLAAATIAACQALRDATGLETAALSGGVFQNLLLLERVTTGLERRGFRVLVHARVPPNDGGISLGQAAVAGARARARQGQRPAPGGGA